MLSPERSQNPEFPLMNPRIAAAIFLGSFFAPAASGHEGHVHTNREAPRLMPLPKNDESFHFLIFGDRTGGPAEGIQVLAQAVRDSNLLDPDLVMTVGDLIQGYNSQRPWEEEMREFRGTMDGLRMPWFPVAGKKRFTALCLPLQYGPAGTPARNWQKNFPTTRSYLSVPVTVGGVGYRLSPTVATASGFHRATRSARRYSPPLSPP
jgi:hypothetical protein